MEHLGALSRFIVLSAVSVDVVAGGFLSVAPMAGGNGYVLPGPSLDRQSSRRGGRRRGIRVQWPDAQLPDVAEQHRWPGLDALVRSAFATRLDCGRARNRLRRGGRRDADALRSARNHSPDMGNPGDFGRRSVVATVSRLGSGVAAICRD